jgi:hypothetical protein
LALHRSNSECLKHRGPPFVSVGSQSARRRRSITRAKNFVLFPELRVDLQKVADEVNLGKETPPCAPISTRYRDRNSNLRTQVERIIRKAGVAPWPKLFQNLRSTRETELAEEFPIQVVCGWIGNTQAVAAKHYLQTTDEHFAKATQKAQQSASEGGRFSRKGREGQRENSEGFANPRDKRAIKAPPVGLEPTT